MYEISNVITRTYGRNKVIDFRDQLVIPTRKEFASVYQQPGEKMREAGKFPSSIGIVICDSTAGTGEKSVTLKANIQPYLIDQWLCVCRANIGTRLIPVGERHPGTQVLSELKNTIDATHITTKKTVSVSEMLLLFVNEIAEILGNVVKGKLRIASMDMVNAIGAALCKLRKPAITKWNMAEAQGNEMATMPSLFIPSLQDYSYTQTRVNSHKMLGGGYCPVSVLNVKRQSLVEKKEKMKGDQLKPGYTIEGYQDNGRYFTINAKVKGFQEGKVILAHLSNGGIVAAPINAIYTIVITTDEIWGYPWYFQIVSFEAVVVTNQNGTTTYDQKTVRNKKEAFIKVSDKDMYEMMCTCQDIIDIFKMASTGAYIKGKTEYNAQMADMKTQGGNY